MQLITSYSIHFFFTPINVNQSVLAPREIAKVEHDTR